MNKPNYDLKISRTGSAFEAGIQDYAHSKKSRPSFFFEGNIIEESNMSQSEIKAYNLGFNFNMPVKPENMWPRMAQLSRLMNK